MDWMLLLEWVIKGFVLTLILLGGFAYLTWYERRALALFQVRLGPNRTGFQGLLQPIADAVKLIFKEELIPAKAEKFLFLLAPVITVTPSVVITAAIPWGPNFMLGDHLVTAYIADIEIGVLYITSIASIAVYGIVIAGWSSNNKYATLGGMRSSAQMVSYELALGLTLVSAVMLVGVFNPVGGSMRLIDIVDAQKDVWFFMLQPVGAFIFWIATLAELNRAPFDMPEAEQELTAGYFTEYSGMKFALFFMAEYVKMITISAIAATLFFGGYREFWFLKDTFFSVDQTPWLGPIWITLKIIVLLFFMIWVRATFPRIRYDRLMAFGWKVMLPASLGVVFITGAGVIVSDQLNIGGSLWNVPTVMWGIPVVSILFAFIVAGYLRRSLMKKVNHV
jgi:NADH-quinone oxidoreductase subunit H